MNKLILALLTTALGAVNAASSSSDLGDQVPVAVSPILSAEDAKSMYKKASAGDLDAAQTLIDGGAKLNDLKDLLRDFIVCEDRLNKQEVFEVWSKLYDKLEETKKPKAEKVAEIVAVVWSLSPAPIHPDVLRFARIALKGAVYVEYGWLQVNTEDAFIHLAAKILQDNTMQPDMIADAKNYLLEARCETSNSRYDEGKKTNSMVEKHLKAYELKLQEDIKALLLKKKTKKHRSSRRHH